jgi:UDP-glucose 6-dehydrogenase
MLGKGAKVVGYDPAAGDAFRRAVPNAMIAPKVNSALAHADVCIVHNDWPQRRDPTRADFDTIRRKVVVDQPRILHREAVPGIELTVLGG